MISKIPEAVEKSIVPGIYWIFTKSVLKRVPFGDMAADKVRAKFIVDLPEEQAADVEGLCGSQRDQGMGTRDAHWYFTIAVNGADNVITLPQNRTNVKMSGLFAMFLCSSD